MSVDLNAVSLFVQIVDTGSFSGAARALHMPKTTVSSHFAALERELGTALIVRTTRKMHVTDAGMAYYTQCKAGLRTLELAGAQVSSTADYPKGTLRVTAAADFAHTLLPPIVDAYTRRYPDVKIQLVISNRPVDLVGEGVDLAFRAGVLQDSSLIGRRLLHLGAKLWAAPRYLEQQGAPRHPDELQRHRFVIFKNARSCALFKGKRRVDIALKGNVQVDDLETLKELVVLGNGIGWLPAFLADGEVQSGALSAVLPDWTLKPVGELHLVYPKQRNLSPAIRAFIDTALASLDSPTRSGRLRP